MVMTVIHLSGDEFNCTYKWLRGFQEFLPIILSLYDMSHPAFADTFTIYKLQIWDSSFSA